ncbi:MAG TPA: hypothetical protein VNB67_09535 [Nitrososphaeraceae archaeon]|jgi:hypothetical protein|nr:hypothetical protein [Nitrososphaeraceae archaeon]
MNDIQFGTGLFIIFLVIIAAMRSFIPLNASAVTITNATLSQERNVGQKTVMSNPASPTVTRHGKLPHQIVFALPFMNDSKIWTGTVTFIASKPIEIEVLHSYKP